MLRPVSFWVIFFLTFIFVSIVHASEIVTGVVFLDENRNLMRDRNESGVKGVSVSNRVDVVRTD